MASLFIFTLVSHGGDRNESGEARAVDRVVPAVSPGPSARWWAVTIYSPNDLCPLMSGKGMGDNQSFR